MYIFSLILLAAISLCNAALIKSAENREPGPVPVPPEEYPIYDVVVQSKFLTSRTKLVMIDRLTVTRVTPDENPISRGFFQENRFFEGALSPALVTDFLWKAVRPSRLEPRFNFGVAYRLISGEGDDDLEVSAAPLPAALLPADIPPPTIGVLKFSRVAFSPREDQALVYVGDHRQDGTGAGFLVLLRRKGSVWEITDTEVIWTVR
ncbi:MAG: hypothetical protein C4293_18065 [Nitrospiraceae bacterium]